MPKEYKAHLILDYGEEVVQWFEDNYRRVNPVKNWQAIIDL